MTFKTRHTDEIKQSIVAEVNDPANTATIAAIATDHGIADATLHGWLRDQRYNPHYLSRPEKRKYTKKKKPNGHAGHQDHADMLIDLDAGHAEKTPINVPARIHDESAFQTLHEQIEKLQKEVSFLRKTTAYFAAQASEDL